MRENISKVYDKQFYGRPKIQCHCCLFFSRSISSTTSNVSNSILVLDTPGFQVISQRILLFTYLICLCSIGQAFSHKKYYSNTNTFSGYSAQYLGSNLAKSFTLKLYWNLKLCRSQSPTLLRFEIVQISESQAPLNPRPPGCQF